MGTREWRLGAVAIALALGAVAGTAVAQSGSDEGSGLVVEREALGDAVLETFELASPLIDTATVGGHLEKDRTVPLVHVLLPPGYDERPDERWPVLWLLHGANGGTDTWIPGVVDDLAAAGVPPAIVVMPDGGTFGMYTNWWNGGQRGGPAWVTYHLDVLRATVEDRYRIRPERRWHTIGGISMGGQGALRYAALLPGYFGSVFGMSAALPDMQAIEAQGGVSLIGAANGGPSADYGTIWGGAGQPYAEGHSAFALAENLADTRIYLTSGSGLNCGGDRFLSPLNLALDSVTELFIGLQRPKFAARARHFGADVTDVPACGVHTFGVWDRAFAAMRSWDFFGEVPSAPDEWVYRTIQTSGEMWGIDYEFAAPPSTVVRFERKGSLLFITGGTGSVTLRGPGCSMTVAVPSVALLTPTCPGVP